MGALQSSVAEQHEVALFLPRTLWNVVWSGTTIRVHAGPGDQITADAVRRVNTLTREMLRSTDRAIPEIKLDLVQDTQTQTRSALGRPGCAPDPALA